MKVFWLSAVLVSAAWGQHVHEPQNTNKAASQLLPSTGDYTFPIHTKNPEAGRFFSQGMAMIYGFNHDEAQRLFRRAAELDPASAMPHWGIALSLGSHINNDPEETREKAAWEAVSKARSLAAHSPDHERRYVEALAARYSPDAKADRKQLARNYSAAMAALHRDYPDDPDAATLYAESMMNLNPWKYWTKDGQPEEGTLEFVGVLENVLRRWPSHPGANHYYIHAVEASPAPERALAAANRLGKLVPAAGHLVHMPSHIYARTGYWEEAAIANADAVKADRAYLKGKPQDGLYPMMYYPHNMHFLLYARLTQGECLPAAQSGKELVAQVTPGLDAMPMLQGFVGYQYQLSVACPQLELSAAPAGKHALAAVAYQFAKGTRAAWRKDVAAATQSLGELESAAKNVAPETIYAPEFTKAYLAVATHSLQARIADASGDLATAETRWREAVDAYDALRYDEPPIWFYAVRQSLGAILLRSKKYSEAEAVLRESLRRQPRDGRVLFVLWKTLKEQNREREAALIESEFLATWKGSWMPKLEEL
jgi:tetratricopeptide (TPR) repeat protein